MADHDLTRGQLVDEDEDRVADSMYHEIDRTLTPDGPQMDSVIEQNQILVSVEALEQPINQQEQSDDIQNDEEIAEDRPPAQCLRQRKGNKPNQVKTTGRGRPKKGSGANSTPNLGTTLIKKGNNPTPLKVINLDEPQEDNKQPVDNVSNEPTLLTVLEKLSGQFQRFEQFQLYNKMVEGSQPTRAQAQPSNSEAKISPDQQVTLSRREKEVIIQTIKPVNPPHFSGECSEALTWLLKFKRTADQNRWSETTKCLHVGESLDAGAQSWYFSI